LIETTGRTMTASTAPPPEAVDLDHVDNDLALLVERTAGDGRRLLLRRAGSPIAVVLPVRDVDRLDRLDGEREDKFAVLHRVSAAFRDVDPAEVEREAVRALSEARAKRRASRTSRTGR